MLSELLVKNLAIIESASLSFGPGANILTGETGAGKSILAGALSLIRGGKAASDMVRKDSDELTVEALFTLENPESFRSLFDNQGLTYADEVIIKRIVYPNGRSRSYLNGSLVTLAQLSLWGEELLAISSQHDQQSLLKPNRQLDFLDNFGAHDALLQKMSASYKKRIEIANELSKITEEIKSLIEKKDFYEFQLKEIQKVNPQAGEDFELMDVKNKAKEDTKLKSLLDDAMTIFFGQEGLLSQIDKVRIILDKASPLEESLTGHSEKLREFSYELGDISKEIKDFHKSKGTDHMDLDEVEERLSALSKLKRKYGPTLDDVLKKKEDLSNSKMRLETLGLDELALKKKLKEIENLVKEDATLLHDTRIASGKKLAKELTNTLVFLGFPKVEMEIDVSYTKPDTPLGTYADSKGGDTISFLFCPNPGEGLKPLSRIASGGELSRVMLALKIAQEPHSDQSLVFDEIDSGLSGAATEAVAAKMAELSLRQQVFVITHQPLMAAIPGKHFLAFKNPEGGRTMTNIHELDSKARQEEVARMLDGLTPSKEAIALSERLLDSYTPK